MALDAFHHLKSYFACVFAAFVILATPVFAQSQPELDVQIEPTWQVARNAALDKLFDDLKSARTSDEAERISNKIYTRFRQSGSDTLDLMATRAREAIARNEAPIAIEILSRLIALDPTWAEAWNVRATAFFLLGDQEKAKADAIETLAREPRHFGALTGLALIYEMQGQRKAALKLYRQVLTLAPELKPIKAAVDRLAKDIEQPM